MSIITRINKAEKRIVDLYNKLKNLPSGGGGVQTISGDFVDNTDPLNPILNDPRPYKVYTALLTQSGTNAPVATVLENTLGDIVWSYNSIGIYHATSIGSFTENKTILPNTYTASTDGSIVSTFDFFKLDENMVSIRTRDIVGNNQDNLINFNDNDFLFEIRVYN